MYEVCSKYNENFSISRESPTVELFFVYYVGIHNAPEV